MSQLNVVKNQSSADQIYYDVTITNFQSTTTIPPIFYYNDQRTMPFVACPEDYYLSILRFTLETGTLPIFIPTIQPNQGNRNLTIYSVTLEYEYLSVNYIAQEFIQWSPQDKSAEIPPPPNATATGIQVNTTGYYNCYSYEWWLALVAQAFISAFANLDAQVTGAGGVLPSAEPPYINWDTSSSSAVLYADVLGYDQNPNILIEQIGIYMNAPLFNLFNSFPSIYLGYVQVLNGKNFQIVVVNIGSTNLQIVTPANGDPQWTAINTYQEYSTIAQWTPITAMVFTSNTLPIQPNQVSTPLVYNNGSQLQFGGNNSDIANIITDLVSTDGQYRPNLVYLPQAQYRYITLYGNRPLFNLDLQIFYRLKTGELVPFRIGSGESVTIKIAFIKKGSVTADQSSK
jgi:hypothetical protein